MLMTTTAARLRYMKRQHVSFSVGYLTQYHVLANTSLHFSSASFIGTGLPEMVPWIEWRMLLVVSEHPQPVPMLAQGPVCWSVGWEEQTTPLEEMKHLKIRIS